MMRLALNSLAMGAIICASVAAGAWLGHGRGGMDFPMASGLRDGWDVTAGTEGAIVAFTGYRWIDGKTVAAFRRVQPQHAPAEREVVLDLASTLIRLGHLRARGVAHEQTLRAVEGWPK